MELSKKEKLDTVSVYDLMNESFYIPDYQRGYRWTSIEVEKLLLDLEEFFSREPKGGEFYCLQPLVVFFNESVKKWEVVDGQQRLTTLYLLLHEKENRLKDNDPNMELFTLSYQSRPGSEEFLTSLDEQKRTDNIDFFHMYNAAKVIREFLPTSKLGAGSFVDAIVNVKNNPNRPSVKFIWYDLTEEIRAANISSEEKFADLNIGKISLTNAELIKALLLNTVKDDESEALRIAAEWDSMEHMLQDEEFWAFIYGKDDGRYKTRIEFLFDTIKNKAPDEVNEYYTFDKYSEDVKIKDIHQIWRDEIVAKFNLLKGWYEDRNLYHIIGFMRYKKHSIQDIIQIFDDQNTKDNEDFFKKLKQMVIQDVVRDNMDISELTYPDNRNAIFDILLLFNILSVLECEKSNVRFSFDDFYKQKFDLEHVRSQTPREAGGEDRRDWIVCNIEYFSGVSYHQFQYEEEPLVYFKSNIRAAPNRDMEVYEGKTAGDICDALLEQLEIESNVTESDIYRLLCRFFNQNSSFEYTDNIGNLVLLDQGTNRGYKNAFFPVKRKWIFNRARENVYILPCTRDVFSKSYSSTIFDLMNWNSEDAQAYTKEIERVIGNAKI